jgi:hypothetical protein
MQPPGGASCRSRRSRDQLQKGPLTLARVANQLASGQRVRVERAVDDGLGGRLHLGRPVEPFAMAMGVCEIGVKLPLELVAALEASQATWR